MVKHRRERQIIAENQKHVEVPPKIVLHELRPSVYDETGMKRSSIT